MKRMVPFAVVLLFASVVASVRAGTTAIGVNLDALAYYGPFTPRLNIADQVGGNYGIWDNPAGTAAASTNADGYPLQDANASLWTPLADWPAGAFTVSFLGSGTLTINGVPFTGGNPGTITLNPAAASNNVMTLSFTNIDPNNPPRELVILPPGVRGSDAAKWNPAFLAKIAPFTCLRTMDWTHTNDSSAVDWSNRATPSSCGWTGPYGVPWEEVIDLANNTAKDIWINIPASASNDYIQQVATLFATNLNAASRLYVEYSNECWNSSFSQEKVVAAAAQANTQLTQTNAGGRLYQQIAWKDQQISKVFKAAFGTRSAQVRVIFAGQSGNFWGIQQGLNYLQSTYGNITSIYAIAGAPYLQLTRDQSGETDAELLANLSSGGLAAATADVQSDVAIANQYHLPYLCYEGGNQVTSLNGANAAAKISIQYESGMGSLYSSYFKMLQQNGVQLFNHYALVSKPTKWGSWGAWDTLATKSSAKGDALNAAALAGPHPPAIPASPLPAGSSSAGSPNRPPPQAVALYGKLVTTSSPSTYYKFSITFTDPAGVLLASVSGRPIYVGGPHGYFVYARPDYLSATTNATTIVGGYRIYPPTPTWTSADNGTYQIWLHKDRVEDVASRFTPGELLGTFTVNIH